MRFGVRIGLAIFFVTSLFVGAASAYFYVSSLESVRAQMRERVLDVGRTGLFLFSPEQREMIRTLDRESSLLSLHSTTELPEIEPGDTAPSLTPEHVALLQARPDFQVLVQTLRQIKNGSRPAITQPGPLPQAALDPERPPVIRYAYILTSLPEIPDRHILKFIADADYAFEDTNENGIMEDDEQPTDIGQLYGLPSPELEAAFDGEAHVANEYYEDIWGTWLTGAFPIHDSGGQVIAVLGIDYGVGSELNVARELAYISVVFLLAGILLSLALSFLVARWLSRPIAELRGAAERVIAGDFSTRLDMRRQDDLGLLAESFNAMMNTIQSSARRLGDMLEELEKLNRVKDEFLANLSHELRTPLSILYGYAAIMLERTPGQELEEMHRAAEQLSAYVSDLILLTDLETRIDIQRSPVRLGPLLDRVRNDLAQTAGEMAIELEVKCDQNLELAANRELLFSALRHVVKNAIVYNAKGGRVRIGATESANTITIDVTDEGIGIAPQEQPRIWDRFYRIDTSSTYSVSGVGTGLFIARRVMELHQASITVESEPGKGSTFHLVLPKSPP